MRSLQCSGGRAKIGFSAARFSLPVELIPCGILTHRAGTAVFATSWMVCVLVPLVRKGITRKRVTKNINDMKNYNKEIVEVLNDLIRINRDRIAGYEKAVENLEEGDAVLRTLFYQLSDESEKMKEELAAEVRSLGGDPADNSTISGKVYRVWMDIKDAFAGDDAKSALEACEYGEDAAQKAYAEAISDSANFPDNIQRLIRDQKDLLRLSHDLIRNKRDEYKAAANRPQLH